MHLDRKGRIGYMQFGMPTLIENRTLEDNALVCAELGLSFVELNMNFPEYQTEGLEQTEKLIQTAEKYGVYYTIHLDENLNVADFNGLVAAAYFETVRRTIEAAKKLVCLNEKYGEASLPLTINTHMNHGIYITLPNKQVDMYERDFDAYMKSYMHFRAQCEEWIGGTNIAIVVENTDGFRGYEKKAIEHLLESPKFGLTWDIGHSKATGEKDMPFILEHKERLMHFHIHDGTETSKKNHLALGDGEIDIAQRLKLAREYGARCVIETKTVAALKQSILWLREHGEM